MGILTTPKPGTKIRMNDRLWEYPKLLPREETLRRLQQAKENKLLTPNAVVIDPDTKKEVIRADHGWPSSKKEVLKKITED